MKRNLSPADRIIRLVLAAILASLYFTDTVTGTWGVVLMGAAAVILLTALINFCPIYHILGIKTSKTKY